MLSRAGYSNGLTSTLIVGNAREDIQTRFLDAKRAVVSSIESADPVLVEVPKIPRSQRGDWTWELVSQYPRQGEWTEAEYLSRDFEGLVEFVEGSLEFLPMVTPFHQDLLMYLCHRLSASIAREDSRRIYLAPLRIRIPGGRHREPDLVLVRPDHIPNRRAAVVGADLTIEIVSGDSKDRARDFIDKRADYAQARIPEYWIIDPETESITALTMPAGAGEYAVHGEFRPGQQAASVLLPGFSVDVDACLLAGRGEPA